MKYVNLSSVLDTYGVALQDRGFMLAFGAARSIAYQLSLPSSAVDVPGAYFATTHGELVSDILSQINERSVIKFDLAKDLTRQLWMLRYNTVYSMDSDAAAAVIDQAIAQRASEIPPKASELYALYEGRGVLVEIDRALKEALGGGI